MGRGQLRIYLGASWGVGKTFAMLSEGHRRQSRGADVVVAVVESHGRKPVAALLTGLEVVSPTDPAGAPAALDLTAVLRRAPAVALVDDLALANPPAAGNRYRWQDVEELLDAGIDVISTLGVEQIESLRDVVGAITGTDPAPTVPDSVLRRAQQIELVDITPEALRRRLAHGNIYPPGHLDAAAADYFRQGNLTALREVALLWLADRVDEGLHLYRTEHGIEQIWEARERIVVALSGGPDGDALIRRAARIAGRRHTDLLAVHVSRTDPAGGADPSALLTQRRLVEALGGTYHQILGDDVSAALLAFARSENATQLVLGVGTRSRLRSLVAGPGTATRTLAGSCPIDVHLVSPATTSPDPRRPRGSPERSRRRRRLGLTLALIGLPLLTLALVPLRETLTLPSDLLLFLVAVVSVALVGDLLPALLAAVGAALLLNFYFTPPLHTFDVAGGDHLIALVIFVGAAALISTLVNLVTRRTLQAAESAAEARSLSTLADTVLRGRAATADLLDQVRHTLGMSSAALVQAGGPDGPTMLDGVGDQPPQSPADADIDIPVEQGIRLLLRGRSLPASDLRVVRAFAAQIAVAIEQQRLGEAAAAAAPAVEADRTRTALLTAVSHDLRTPLASAKAAVAGLRSPDVSWTPEQRDGLLTTAEESLARLTRLVENLLDMSRLQAGALSVFPHAVALDDVVAHALREVDPQGTAIDLAVPDDLPEVWADAALLERVVVNLLTNALRHSAPDRPPVISASSVRDRVEIRVADRGPGVPRHHREEIFAPFQRRGDTDNTTGVGLGLALVRGLTTAMGGSVEADDTPGGGLTMVVTLPIAPRQVTAVPPGSRETRAAGPPMGHQAEQR